MGSERKKYVIQSEFAMRREIACRERIQRLSLVQTPSLTQTPITLPMPTPLPSPFPTLNLSPHRLPMNPAARPTDLPATHSRPNPTYSAHDHHRKRKQPLLPQPGNFFCNICHVDCTSLFNLRMHFKGHKHKTKLKERNAKKIDTRGGVGVAKKIKNEKPYCELCGIFGSDELCFREHLLGKSHTLKLLATQKKIATLYVKLRSSS